MYVWVPAGGGGVGARVDGASHWKIPNIFLAILGGIFATFSSCGAGLFASFFSKWRAFFGLAVLRKFQRAPMGVRMDIS